MKAAIENQLTIVAVCDINPDKMTSLLGKYGLSTESIHCYVDYHEMLINEELDVIAIATESGKHAKIALDVIEHGCSVIIEKPMALSINEAERIVETAKRKQVKVTVCHQNRFNKSIQNMRKAIEEEQFGKIFYGTAQIRWHRDKNYYTQAPWRGTYEQDGGALMNQCIHNIDLLKWMLGDEIESVVSYTDNLSHPYIETEDFGIALIRFTNGCYGIIEGTTCIFPENLEETLCIFGEKGTVKAGGKSVNQIDVWKFDNQWFDKTIIEDSVENPENVYGFGHKLLYQDMIQAIEDNREPLVDGTAGKEAVALVLAIYESAVTHSIVKFPLSNRSTLDYK